VGQYPIVGKPYCAIFASMQPSANYYPPFGSSEKDAEPNFNVVIAYEDFDTGKLAKRTFDVLNEQLKNDCRFTNQMWKFDVLNIPKLREMAAKDAAMADIVIISCRAKDELAPEVKAWIELWLAQESHVIALVALLDSSPELQVERANLRRYLAEVAARGRMEFFAQPNDLPEPARSLQSWTKESATPSMNLAMASLARTVEREGGFPRWGINE
jgi:hypothetical protein